MYNDIYIYICNVDAKEACLMSCVCALPMHSVYKQIVHKVSPTGFPVNSYFNLLQNFMNSYSIFFDVLYTLFPMSMNCIIIH